MPFTANPQNIEIDPSRRLIGSPDWGDLAVIFDARSGDFWIVSNETQKVLLSTTPNLAHLVDKDVMNNLIAHGIIRASRSS